MRISVSKQDLTDIAREASRESLESAAAAATEAAGKRRDAYPAETVAQGKLHAS